MATQIQFRKGTKIQHASFTGANAEVTVNTTDKTLHVHDGSTVGGIEAARTDLANVVGVTSLSVSGITTVGSLSIDANEVISSARQLKNIASLDATTTATIESAIAAAPNDFTNLNVTGISTLGNTVVGGATTQLIVTGNARVTGIITVGTSSITLDGVNNRIAVGSGLTITESGITIGPTTINSSGSLSGTAGTITTLDSTSATITNGTITNLTGTAATITTFNSTNGTITNLTGTAGTITTFNNTDATITNATITNLTGTAGTITTLNSTNGTITNGTITNLTGTAGTVTTFNSTVGSITNLTSTNVNASGIVTATTAIVGAATTINATGVNATGIVTAAQFVTGASGSAIGINTNTISGPAVITIDPAGVGDNTGAVRIKGDLLVDGEQFIVNSTTIELADFIVGIASTATTDTLADGAGIKIGPDNTLTYDHSNTALKSSENLNLASGKTYKINGTDVLSATTLGNAVVSSSLTSLGTIASLVATNGTITNLTSTNVNASGIVTATTAIVGAGVTIDSSGINAGITSVTAGLFFGQNLDVGDAFVGIATIVFLNSTDGTITNGTITNLTGTAGTITTFNNTDATITNATITNLTGTAGTITTFSSTNGTITNLTGTAGTITTFNSTDGTITNGTITNLTGTAGTITTFDSTAGTITNGTITNLTGTAGTITTFDSTSATITNLTSTNTNASGISTVGSLSIDANEVISSARQLKNIASLDATTTATIESAIAAGPNNFTDLTITGFSTFTNGPVVIGTATSTGTASQRLQVTGGAYISGDVGIGNTLPSFKADIAGDARITSTNKMRFGGTTESTNFYIAYNSTTNSLDFVQG